jgi:hypothetical protein
LILIKFYDIIGVKVNLEGIMSDKNGGKQFWEGLKDAGKTIVFFAIFIALFYPGISQSVLHTLAEKHEAYRAIIADAEEAKKRIIEVIKNLESDGLSNLVEPHFYIELSRD